MTSDTQHAESGSSIGRRTFIKGVGAAGAAGVGLSGRGPSAVESAEALPPLVIAGAYAAGTAASGVSVGWALRDLEIIGSNPPAEGTTGDVLIQNAYQTARARSSNNGSTFVDNQNLADGVLNNAYTEGKIAAIERLNAEDSLENVQGAAETEAASYLSTVQKNLLKSWNESVREFETVYNQIESHPDVSYTDWETRYNSMLLHYASGLEAGFGYFNFNTISATLADGTTFDVLEIELRHDRDNQSGDYQRWSALGREDNSSDWNTTINSVVPNPGEDYESFEYQNSDDWSALWDEYKEVENTVLGGLQNWTSSVYTEVQSGDIDVSDLLTPREQATLLSDDEEYPQAVADLIALNIPVDPDREATISFTERDITISGLMAPTSPPESGFTVGETYDPSAEPWDLYFTYDPSRGSGGWSEYEPLIAEGELRFTEEPYAGVLYRVPTNLGTVEVVSDDFEEIDGGLWAADVSEQIGRTTEEWTDYQTGIDGGTVTFGSLPDEAAEFDITTNQGDTETVAASDFEADGEDWTVETSLGIAEVDSVTAHIDRATIEEAISIYSEDGSANYETVQIREEFTLDRLEDSDGNEVESAEFSQTEPQDDTNYITQEEWDELEQQNQELIDKYEEAASSDDSFFGGGGFDFGGIGEIPAGATAAAAGVAVVVVIVGALRQVASFYLPGK